MLVQHQKPRCCQILIKKLPYTLLMHWMHAWVWSVGSVQCCSHQPLHLVQVSGEGDEAVSWSLRCGTRVMGMLVLVPGWCRPKLKTRSFNTACFSPTVKLTRTLVLLQSNSGLWVFFCLVRVFSFFLKFNDWVKSDRKDCGRTTACLLTTDT